jgi:tellurite methyltransferase
LPFLRGTVLDLGCGLGNLSIAAASRGAQVTAVDACGRAVEDVQRRATACGLEIEAQSLDLRDWRPDRQWDVVACIGLLMFFAPEEGRAGLQAAKAAVAPGGVAVVNVLVEGTTYVEMFGAEPYCLFRPGEVQRAFAGWDFALAQTDDFPAPGGTVKRFETVIAFRPPSA